MSILSRRTFLNRTLLVPLAGTTACAVSACGSQGSSPGGGTAAASVCADPRKLTAAENAQRQSFHYLEQSTDDTKVCAGCSFFTPPESGTGCGQCQVLLGPANPRGHCDSWAAKAG